MTLCDTHIHVVDDPVRYPMIPSRTYTPDDRDDRVPAGGGGSARDHAVRGGAAELLRDRQYGRRSRRWSALGANGAGVAVVDADSITEAELRVMAESRVRGVRINLYSTHGVAPRQSLRGPVRRHDRALRAHGLARAGHRATAGPGKHHGHARASAGPRGDRPLWPARRVRAG